MMKNKGAQVSPSTSLDESFPPVPPNVVEKEEETVTCTSPNRSPMANTSCGEPSSDMVSMITGCLRDDQPAAAAASGRPHLGVPSDRPVSVSPTSDALRQQAQDNYMQGQYRCSLPARSAQPPRVKIQRANTDAQILDRAELVAQLRGKLTLETHKIEHVETDQGDTVNQYRITDQIGQGSFGKVCEAVGTQTGESYAIKIMSKARLARLSKRRAFGRSPNGRGRMPPGPRRPAPSAAVAEADPLEQVKREIAILKSLDHPNIIKLFEVMDDSEEDELYMVFELMSAGAVMGDDLGESFDEKTSLSYFVDLMLGVEYLHARHIAHRDIKPPNLLLDETNHIKITDFGVSDWFSGQQSNQHSKASSDSGSPAFMAPEQLGHKNGMATDDMASMKSDIWAMGITLYCFLFGELPFKSGSILELHRLIKEEDPTFPEREDISSNVQDFIRRMLEKDPERRITIAEMREHPWLSGVPLPPVQENCNGVDEVSDGEVAAAFSALSVDDLESLLFKVASFAHAPRTSSIDIPDGPLLQCADSLAGNFRRGSSLSTASATSAASAASHFLMDSLGTPDISEEQESVLLRLAQNRRPSFNTLLWSREPSLESPSPSQTPEAIRSTPMGSRDSSPACGVRTPSPLADSAVHRQSSAHVQNICDAAGTGMVSDVPDGAPAQSPSASCRNEGSAPHHVDESSIPQAHRRPATSTAAEAKPGHTQPQHPPALPTLLIEGRTQSQSLGHCFGQSALSPLIEVPNINSNSQQPASIDDTVNSSQKETPVQGAIMELSAEDHHATICQVVGPPAISAGKENVPALSTTTITEKMLNWLGQEPQITEV